MGEPGLGQRKVVATVAHLLKTTLIRVGNREYAKANKSFGLTTLQDRHVSINGSQIHFKFRGKTGKEWCLKHSHRRVARIVKSCQDLPGQHLFQYEDEGARARQVTSQDVNEYLRETTEWQFRRRTSAPGPARCSPRWRLREYDRVDSQAAAQSNIRRAIEAVAGRLGNTATVCRKCYVHPEVLACYLEGSLLETLNQKIRAELKNDLAESAPRRKRQRWHCFIPDFLHPNLTRKSLFLLFPRKRTARADSRQKTQTRRFRVGRHPANNRAPPHAPRTRKLRRCRRGRRHQWSARCPEARRSRATMSSSSTAASLDGAARIASTADDPVRARYDADATHRQDRRENADRAYRRSFEAVETLGRHHPTARLLSAHGNRATRSTSQATRLEPGRSRPKRKHAPGSGCRHASWISRNWQQSSKWSAPARFFPEARPRSIRPSSLRRAFARHKASARGSTRATTLRERNRRNPVSNFELRKTR